MVVIVEGIVEHNVHVPVLPDIAQCQNYKSFHVLLLKDNVVTLSGSSTVLKLLPDSEL
jgi:Ran GTPase-activating protein (RanGAP) involved in mRNA processing and transport